MALPLHTTMTDEESDYLFKAVDAYLAQAVSR